MIGIDLSAFARDLALDLAARTRTFVVEHVASAINEFTGRIAALEQRMANVRDGKDGKDGRDGTQFFVGTGPAPFSGDDGDVYLDAKTGEVSRWNSTWYRVATIEREEDAEVSVLRKEVEELRRLVEAMKAQPSADDVSVMVAEKVSAAVAELPTPKDGKDGKDGTSVSVADVQPFIAEAVSKVVAEIPLPKDGKDGKDGASVDIDVVSRMVADRVEAVLKTWPRPQDGKSVSIDDVRPVVEAEVERAVTALPKPKDGIGVVGALVDRDGHLVLTFSDGSAKDVGTVVGQDADLKETARLIESQLAAWPKPSDGKDGRDGTLEQLALSYDGRRTVTFRFKDGTPVQGGVIKFPIPLDAGVFKQGQRYEHGDGVTYAGSYWVATADTDETPGDGSTKWRLVVRKGRDGKHGQQGPEGPRGPKGDKGDPGGVYR